MKQIVYRGVEYEEALRVVQAQRYEREERRRFVNGASANAVFGSGVYLVSNPTVAAQYAICHAETMWDKAAVLSQELQLEGLFSLDGRYGENELRLDALRTKYTEQELQSRSSRVSHREWLEWTGEEVRSYLLANDFRGIRYWINPGLTYYICFQPDKQITSIRMLSVLDVREMP